MLTRRQRDDLREVVKEEVTEALRDVLPWLAMAVQPTQVQAAPAMAGSTQAGHGPQARQGPEGQHGQQGQQGPQGQQDPQHRRDPQPDVPPVVPVAVPVAAAPPAGSLATPGWPAAAAGVPAFPGHGPIPPDRQAAQYISQMFVQAQAELAAELAANLHQLRQVISDSQQIARKIESLLGQEGRGGGGQAQGGGRRGGDGSAGQHPDGS